MHICIIMFQCSFAYNVLMCIVVTSHLVTTTILVTGAIFFVFSLSVCARVEVTTNLTVRRPGQPTRRNHDKENLKAHNESLQQYDHRHKAHNTTIRHSGGAP
jgi:hypothetical protein